MAVFADNFESKEQTFEHCETTCATQCVVSTHEEFLRQTQCGTEVLRKATNGGVDNVGALIAAILIF